MVDVLVFKGIAPPSPFPATAASGAPPRPNHACCEGGVGVDVCFETLPYPTQQRVQNQSGPTSGRKCYITPAFSGVPNKGDKIKVGPQVGGNATSPKHPRGSPKKGGQNQNWMPNPCLLGGPQVGGNATSPLHSREFPKKGGQNQNWMPNPCLLGGPQVGAKCYITPAFSGMPHKGDKVKAKKRQKNKNKNCPMVSPSLPIAL